MLKRGYQALYRRRLPVIAVVLLYLFLFWAGMPCLFQTLFHVPCPGCGMTHALLALLRLDLAEAFRCHPMVYALPLLLAFILYDGKLTRWPAVNGLLLGGVALGFGICYIVRLWFYFSI